MGGLIYKEHYIPAWFFSCSKWLDGMRKISIDEKEKDSRVNEKKLRKGQGVSSCFGLLNYKTRHGCFVSL